MESIKYYPVTLSILLSDDHKVINEYPMVVSASLGCSIRYCVIEHKG